MIRAFKDWLNGLDNNTRLFDDFEKLAGQLVNGIKKSVMGE